MEPRKYNFASNDPFDHDSPIRLVIPPLKSSIDFMQSIIEYNVKKNSLAIWTLGQNGFILKSSDGTTICIDPYLSNYCAEAEKYQHFNIRLDRQLPVFIYPEDLDVDIVLTTHSHDDHADPFTLSKITISIPPFTPVKPMDPNPSIRLFITVVPIVSGMELDFMRILI